MIKIGTPSELQEIINKMVANNEPQHVIAAVIEEWKKRNQSQKNIPSTESIVKNESDTQLNPVDNTPREIITITKLVSQKGEQNKFIYTREQIDEFARKEGITGEEYLNRYRRSGSAYSVKTSKISPERISKGKERVSDIGNNIFVGGQAGSVPIVTVPTDETEVAFTGTMGGYGGSSYKDTPKDIVKIDALTRFNDIRSGVTFKNSQEEIASKYFDLKSFEKFRKDNAKTTTRPSSNPNVGNITSFENRPLDVDEREFFGTGAHYKQYKQWMKTGILPREEIEKSKFGDKFRSDVDDVLFDIRDQKSQEFLSQFNKEDRYRIQYENLESIEDWPETPTGITAFEAEALRVAKDVKDFKNLTGRDLVGKQIVNGRVYNDTVDIKKLENVRSEYLKKQGIEVTELGKDADEKIQAYEKYERDGVKSINDQRKNIYNIIEQIDVENKNSPLLPELNKNLQAAIAKHDSDLDKFKFELTKKAIATNVELIKYDAIANDLYEKGERFNDTKYLNYAVALNYNNIDRMLLNLEKDILGSGSIFFTKTALNLANLWNKANELVPEEYREERSAIEAETIEALDNAYGASVSWKEELDKEFGTKFARPIEIRTDNIGSWIPQLLADGAPSLAMVLAPLGAAKLISRSVQFGGNIAKLKYTKDVMSYGMSTVLGAFMVSETGSKMGENEMNLKRSKKLLNPNNPEGLYAQLDEAKKMGLTSSVHTINQAIYDQQRARDLTGVQKAISEYGYGIVAMYAEKLGTLRYIQNFQRYANAYGKSNFKKLIGVGRGVATGVVIEDIEEVVTQFLHNTIDVTVLGEDKSFFEGLDSKRFHMQNVLNAFVLQGGNIATNVNNLMQDELRTRLDIKTNRRKINELIEVQKQLKDPNLPQKERQKLIERKRQLINEAQLQNATTYHQLAYLTPDQIKKLGELNRKRRENNKSQYELGRSGLKNKTLQEQLKQEAIAIEEQREQLLNKDNKSDKNKNQDSAFLQGVYDLAYETAKLKGENVVEVSAEHVMEIKIGEEKINILNPDYYIYYNEKHIDQINEMIRNGENGANAGGFKYVNQHAITSRINSLRVPDKELKEFKEEELPLVAYLEAYRAALTPMHELMHDDITNSKFEKSDISKNGVDELKVFMKSKFDNKSINETEYKYFKKILEQYDKQDSAVEILPAIYEFMEMGIIKPADFSFLYGIRNFLDDMVTKISPDSKMFFPFITNEDVFSYISNFYKRSKSPSSSIITQPEEKEFTADEVKKSLGLINFNTTEEIWKQSDWQNLTKEEKLEKGILMAIGWENYVMKRIKSNLNFKAPDREIEMLAQQFVFDVKRGLPEIFSRFNPDLNDSISAWTQSGGENMGQLDLRILEVLKESGYYSVFQVELDKDDTKELVDDSGVNVEEALNVLGLKNNINLPEGVNKKINTGIKKAILKYKDKNLTPKELRDNLTKDFRQIAFKEIKNSFKSRVKYKEYMDKNFEKVFNKMEKTTLAKRFRSDERAVKKYGEDKDLFIKPAINPETGKQYRITKTNTSQPGVWFKPEFKDINKKKKDDYFFGDKLTPQMISNRKTTVTEEISNALGFDEAINIMFNIETLRPDTDKIKELIPAIESENSIVKTRAEAFVSSLNKAIDRRIKLSKGLGTVEQVEKIQEVLADKKSTKVLNRLLASNDFHHKYALKTLLSRLLLDDTGLFSKSDITNISNKLNKVFVNLLQIKASIPKNRKFDILDYLNTYVKEELTSNDMVKLLKQYGYDALVYDQTDIDDILDGLHVYSLLAKESNIDKQDLNALLYAVGGSSRMGGTIFKWNGKTQTVEEFLDSKNYKEDKSMTTSESRFGLLESVALARTFLKVKGDLEFTIGKDKNGKDITITRTASSLSKHTSNSTHRALIKKGYDEKTITELTQTGEINQAILIKVAKAVRNLFQDGLIGKRALQGFMNSLDSTQKGLLRTAALLGYIPKLSYSELVKKFKLKEYTDPKTKEKFIKITVEHLMPTKFMKGLMFDYIVNPKETSEFELALKEYKLAIIPEGLDRLLPSWLKSRMNIGFKIGDKSIARYINELTKGKFGIELIDVYSKNQTTVGKNEQSEFLINLNKIVLEGNKKILGELFDFPTIQAQVDQAIIHDKALNNARTSRKSKGISIIDFDDTLAITDSKINYTIPRRLPDGRFNWHVVGWGARADKGSLTPAEFAKQYDELILAGAVFDYGEFSEVKGGKKGPFFNKAKELKEKFGNTDIFVLTARPAESAAAIQAFLKGVGLDLIIENIIGLEDGRPEAKKEFIIQKASEGYNDFLFADDQIKNVKAVKEAFDALDIKGKAYEVKSKASKGLSNHINKIIEEKTGTSAKARFSEAAAKARGYNVGKWKFFVPPSAEDFAGLMYVFLTSGKKGDQQLKWFNEVLFKPFARGIRDINTAKQNLANDYAALRKDFPNIAKLLGKETSYNKFTFDNAIRVYLWDKFKIDIPGLSKRDTKALVKIVKDDADLQQFADGLSTIFKLKEDGYVSPGDNWFSGNIDLDIMEVNMKVNRPVYLKEWINNKNEIFNKANLNKMEALFGTNWINALKDMLYRMETGINRSKGSNKLVNEVQDWINGAVGNIMFLNTRSATLQLISFANFINWSDNNMLKAGIAFANQPQFLKDFMSLFNSDFLKQRRAGLQIDVNVNELANTVATSKGTIYEKAKAVIAYILKKGYTPTQIADSTAIAFGGAMFYRNRLNTYLKQGMKETEAKEQAFEDFQEIAEATQQSARPDLISEQQASVLGRAILAFQNVTMQYNRAGKKAILDLINNRGDKLTNISKITYYFAIQNFIFNALQAALFALMFSDEEDEKEKEKYFNLANKMGDSILRGLGVGGAVISTLKNMVIQFARQSEKGYRADYTYVLLDGINVSPPIGAKSRKVYKALQTYKWDKEVMSEMGFDIDNPSYTAIANVTSAGLNIPFDRAMSKIDNIQGALNSQNQAWQRVAMALGWPGWTVGSEDRAVEEVKEQIRKRKYKERKKKNKKRKYIPIY